jgi:transcriptional regulator with XRE-family HTH domain
MSKSHNSIENQLLTAWLKRQRLESGLSMRELAERLRVPHTFVAKVEQKERRLDVVEFVSYCRAMGVSPLDGIDVIEQRGLKVDLGLVPPPAHSPKNRPPLIAD